MALRPEIGWLVKYQYSGIPIPLSDPSYVNTGRADKPDETKVVISGGKPSAGDTEITMSERDDLPKVEIIADRQK